MNSTYLSILLGVAALIAAGGFIIKGYNAKGVLFSIGIVLMAIAYAMGNAITKTPGGDPVADISNHIYGLFENRGGALGMIIMILIGFSAYMSHVGANDVVIRVLYKPLRHVRSPYVLLVGGFILSALMSFAIHSATALGVFLMATLFPIMVRLGISVPSAAAICSSTTLVNLAPTAADVILAAEKANADLITFSFKTIMPMSIVALFFVAIAHFFWQRYLDRKEKVNAKPIDMSEIRTDVPTFYAILPLLPIIGVILFDGKWFNLPELHIVTVIILCFVITAVIDFIRNFSAKKTFDNLVIAYRGMADAFAGVVMLLVAAGVFAQSLSTIGFITNLINSAQSFGGSGLFMMLVLAVITILATMATGSGNAAFYAFAELIPKLATQMGANPAYLTVPMLQASNLGRGLSPVSGVVVAVSGLARISPFEIVKRMSVPMAVGFICVIIATEFFIPGA